MRALTLIGSLLKLDAFSGVRTYVAAAGLIGLAISQFSTGAYDAGWQSLMTGIGLLGLHAKIDTATVMTGIGLLGLQAKIDTATVPATTVTTVTTTAPEPTPPPA